MPDNLKAGVSRTCRYEPDINPVREMAEYYGAVVIPARPRRPRDKAKVERVQVVEGGYSPRYATSPSLAYTS